MKTIEIQNCTDNRDGAFQVLINGEKHLMRHQSLKIQVADDKPFEVAVKGFGAGSPVFTFEPKDDSVIQILYNRRLDLVNFLLMMSFLLALFVFNILNKSRFTQIIFSFCILLFPLIFYIFRSKKYFVIREVINKKAEEQ
jgi:hypothetical protein